MKQVYARSLSSLMIIVLFMVTTMRVFAYPGGSPAAKTGSPGDGSNCTSCHGGSAATVTGWITSNIPGAGYTPGSTYTITVSVTGSGNHGFEVSPQNVPGALLGTLIAGSGNKLVGSGKYVTQSSSQSGNPQTWTFQWVAPAAGTGLVTFYGAFCVTKSNTKLSTLAVNENAAVPLGVVASANPGTINLGGSSNLSATATGGTGSYTYSWTSVPAGFTSAQQNPVVSPTVTTTYTVVASDGSGSASANTTVTVNIPAPLNVVASATPSTINVGQTSQLNAAVSGGTGTYTYAWTSFPAGFTSVQQNPVVSPVVTTQYTVTVNDGQGNSQSNTTVTIAAVPISATAYATPSVVCNGQTSQLSVTASGGSGSYTYSWTSVPAGFTSTQQNPVVSPTVATQYHVSVTDGSLSGNASTNVTVNQPATASAGNDTTYANAVTQIQLNGTASNYSSLLWTTSGTGTFSTSITLSSLYFPSQADKTAGNITLTLTASAQSPCTASATSARHIHFDGPIGIADINRGAELLLSPNPSTGVFSLRINEAVSAETTVTICDLRGKTVLVRSMQLSAGKAELIDMTGFPKGIYLVKIQNERISGVSKLVLE